MVQNSHCHTSLKFLAIAMNARPPAAELSVMDGE